MVNCVVLQQDMVAVCSHAALLIGHKVFSLNKTGRYEEINIPIRRMFTLRRIQMIWSTEMLKQNSPVT